MAELNYTSRQTPLYLHISIWRIQDAQLDWTGNSHLQRVRVIDCDVNTNYTQAFIVQVRTPQYMYFIFKNNQDP